MQVCLQLVQQTKCHTCCTECSNITMNLVNEEYDGSQCQIEFCDVTGHSVFSGVGFNGHFGVFFSENQCRVKNP